MTMGNGRRLFVACLAAVGLAGPARGTVFYARDEALRLAFPDAERAEARDFFLTAAQRTEIERRAQAPLDSDLLTVYLGYRHGAVAGYAIFDTHVVRTLPETFLVVLTPEGAVSATYLLAFYEPPEYVPAQRWLRQFDGKRVGDDLRIGHGIAGITGSTLTSYAVAGGIRRALAIYAVLLGGR